VLKVKVCGIRRLEDAMCVNKYKPDYVGFIFSKSKRQVTLKEAKSLSNTIDPNIKKVGVFVDEDISYVKCVAMEVKLDVIQFHGMESDEYISNFNDFVVWKALKIKGKVPNFDFRHADGILLDSKRGGSGKKFNWNLTKNFKTSKTLILAGGLNLDNVEEAVSIVNPDIVDVSSGVETSGFKDPEKIKMFIEKVRSIN
jgi:phosphoribosylanthranilate isomerase